MKRRNKFVSFMVIIILSAVISFVYAEEKIDLRLQLQKGQSYKMRMVNDMKINQTIPGQQQTVTTNQKMETRNIYTVEDVQADGTLVLKVTYDAILLKAGNPAVGIVEYDSSDTSTAVGRPTAPVFFAIVGQSFTITITPDGHVKEIKGADALLGRIQEKINELPDEGPMSAGMAEKISSKISKMQYSEEALKANTENLFNMYPDKPVGIGDTWQKKTAISQQGLPMIIDAIYTLKERKDGIAIIDIFAMIQPNREAGPMEMDSMKVNYNISGNMTGVMEMQESTGWPVRSNMTLKLSGNMTATVENPKMPQPMSMSIPISMSGTITQEPY